MTVRSAYRREWSRGVPACAVSIGIAAVTLLVPNAGNVSAFLRLCLAGSVAALATLAGLWDA